METSEITRRKKALRAQLLTLRRELSSEQRRKLDTALTQQVVALPEWKTSALVLTYFSVGAEVDTRELIDHAWEAGKTVALPRVITHTRLMNWYRISDFEQLEKTPLGVFEPVADPKNLIRLADEGVFGIPSIALVPGLGFDKQGYRIGYGGGFYDSFLASFAGYSVGLCREEQLCESLKDLGVIDTYDQSVGLVVSEQHVIRP